MFSSIFGTEQQRLDPEDGVLRTYKEVFDRYKNRYSEKDVKDYWEQYCTVPGQQDSVATISTVKDSAGNNDPFATHAQSRAQSTRPQQQSGGEVGRSLVNVAENPFLTGAAVETAANVRKDPFLTLPEHISSRAKRGEEDRRMEMLNAARQVKRHWSETLARVTGPGDPDRSVAVRNVFVMGPWLLFMWLLLVWTLLQHYSKGACIVLMGLSFLACFAMLGLWQTGKRWGPVSLLPLGFLCFIAVIMSYGVGKTGWNLYWRQYWWLQTGQRFERTTASTPAGARIDAAVIGFWDDGSSKTMNGTSVDYMRAAGYKDEHFYCVAPILDIASAGADLSKVNYWAIGLDCCQSTGSFTCDASRERGGSYGVVMLDGGYPCPTCNVDKYQKAVLKAEATHGLVSSKNALFVRWVESPNSVENVLLLRSLLFLFVTGGLSLAIAYVLGGALWYFGVGKPKFSSREPLRADAWAKC